MSGKGPDSRRGSARLGIVLLCLVLVHGLSTAPTTAAQAPPPPVVEQPPPRITYSGTEHRSLGITSGLPGQSATEPLLEETPQHFDQDVSSRDGLLVFTSLRDERTSQVYLRNTDGSIRRLTEGRDAANPELSPDLQWVAFDSAEPSGDGTQRDVWLVRVDGSQAHRLTNTTSNESHPTFAPDGTRLAYSADSDGTWQLYEQPMTGGNTRQLTNEPSGGAIEPAWNPVDDAEHRDQIAYTFDANGDLTDDLDQGVRILQGTGTGTGTPLLDGTGWHNREPRWLPDGDQLLYVSPDLQEVSEPGTDAAEPGRLDRVYRVDTTTLPVVEASELMLEEDRLVDSPTWFTDNGIERLVVARTTAPLRNTAMLQDIRADGSDPRSLGVDVLTEDPAAVVDSSLLFEPGPGFDPWTQRQSYSPDGAQIAVSRFETIGGERVQRIWLVGEDGSDPRPLHIADRQPGDWETDAAWSPDGSKLAVARRSPGAQEPGRARSRIVIVDVATGEVTGRLETPHPERDDTQPAWSPDGETLAFSRGRVADVPEGQPYYNHVWTVPTDSLDQQRDLSATILQDEVVDDSPAFSPDGRSIVFNREPDGLIRYFLDDGHCDMLLPTELDTCVVDQPTSGEDGPFHPRDISWSPDGKQLVLSARQDRNANSPERSAILDLGTGDLTPLTAHLPGRQKESSWQATVDLTLAAPPSSEEVEVGSTGSVTATIRNQGPATSPGTEVNLDVPDGLRLERLRPSTGHCDTDSARCDFGALPAGQYVEVTADFSGVTPGDQRVSWTTRGAMADTRVEDNTATTVVPVTPAAPDPPPPPPPPPANTAVGVTAAPNPSYVGGRTDVTFTVRNTGHRTATGLELVTALPPDVPVVRVPPGCTARLCSLPDLPPGGVLTRHVVLAPKAALRAEVRATLRTTGTDSNPRDNRDSSPYRVLQPRVVAVPEIGEPGFVTSVRGVDFPPGAPVRLRWNPGITAAAAPNFPRSDGRFAAQLLILPKDQTGPRVITASGPGFSPVSTEFLVVKPTVTPPGWVGRR